MIRPISRSLTTWILSVALATGFVGAQSVQFFEDFDGPLSAQAHLLGTAEIDGGVLKLTDARQDQLGNLLIDDFLRGQPLDRFFIQFRVRVGGGTGADGFSFNVARDLSGVPFGEEGAGTGLQLSFDTFVNPGEPGPSVDLRYGTNTVASRTGFDVLRTGEEFVTVRARYQLSGKFLAHSLKLDYGLQNVFDNPVWFGPALGSSNSWGFGARTGAATDNHWIDDLFILANFTDGPPTAQIQPSNTRLRYGERATLRLLLNGTPPFTNRWSFNGVFLAEMTVPTFVTAPMNLTAPVQTYQAVISNSQGATNSGDVVVTLDPKYNFTNRLSRGYNLIANPINAGGNLIGELWPTAPQGATFWKFNNGTQQWEPAETFTVGRGWSPGVTRIPPGDGGWMNSPVEFDLPSTGEVGSFPIPDLGFGRCLVRGRPLPDNARYEDIVAGGALDGTSFSSWNAASHGWSSATYFDGIWFSSSPTLPQGEAAIICAGSATPGNLPNAPPTLSLITDRVIEQGTTTGPIAWMVFDAETPAASLAVTAVSSDPILVPPSGLILGGTGADRTLEVVPAAAKSGRCQISVIVDDLNGRLITNSFQLRVRANTGPPRIDQHPAGIVTSPGATVTLNLDVEGAPPIAINWRRNGAFIPGATNAQFVITNIQPTNGATYSAVVFNDLGADDSSNAVVRVAFESAVPLSPNLADASVFLGSQGLLGGSNEGVQSEPIQLIADKPPGYALWFRWRPPVTGIATIRTLGSTMDTLLAVYRRPHGPGGMVRPLDAGTEEVVSNDDAEPSYTSSVTFNTQAEDEYTVATAGFAGRRGNVTVSLGVEPTTDRHPMIRTHPHSVATTPGGTTNLTVITVPEAGESHQYQWFFQGRKIEGANESTLTFDGAGKNHVGDYYVAVSNGKRTNQSETAFLELNTGGFGPSVNKIEDSPNGSTATTSKRIARAQASIPLSVGRPVAHLLNPNSAYNAQDWEKFKKCGLVYARSPFIEITVDQPGRLVADTYGSPAPTVIKLFKTNANEVFPTEIGDCSSQLSLPSGQFGSVFVSPVLAGPATYKLMADLFLTTGQDSSQAQLSPFQINWTILPVSAPRAQTSEFTEEEIGDFFPMAFRIHQALSQLRATDAAAVRLAELEGSDDFLFKIKTQIEQWHPFTNLVGRPSDFFQNRLPDGFATHLVETLNTLVNGASLLSSAEFKSPNQRTIISILAEKTRSPDEQALLNRLVLEDAFPSELPRLRTASLGLPQQPFVWNPLGDAGTRHFRIVDDPGQWAWSYRFSRHVETILSNECCPEVPIQSDSWLKMIFAAPAGPGSAAGSQFFRLESRPATPP